MMQGVKVCNEDDAEGTTAPHCAHGATVLFEQTTKGKVKKFYACSANRDRKRCGFYCLVEEGGKRMAWKALRGKAHQALEMEKFCEEMDAMRSLEPKKRRFCRACGRVVREGHKNHPVMQGVSDEQLQSPFSLLDCLNHNQSNAQFLFSQSSVRLITHIISNLNVKAVICLGTPSLHHAFRRHDDIDSILLDIDHRLITLNNYLRPHSACHYNMFNHHFFTTASHTSFFSFVHRFSPDDLIILVDPPFGGMVELLMRSLHQISAEVYGEGLQTSGEVPGGGCEKGLLKTILVLPYFLESKVCKPWIFKQNNNSNNNNNNNNNNESDNKNNNINMNSLSSTSKNKNKKNKMNKTTNNIDNKASKDPSNKNSDINSKINSNSRNNSNKNINNNNNDSNNNNSNNNNSNNNNNDSNNNNSNNNDKGRAQSDFHMVDCSIEYEGHKGLSKGGPHSVVRLFTNIPPHHILLPLQEGFKFCKPCRRFVSRGNRHCFKCRACTTKVGDTYRHCDTCQRCVKASWRHCPRRGVCCLPGEARKRKAS